MRAFLIGCSLLVLTNSVFAAERTWTIARDVFTADGELIAVRGESVYIKIDGKVEEVAIDRLSAIDQQYLATLSLAPVSPGPELGPGEERSLVVQPGSVIPGVETVQKAVAQEEMPLPGPSDQGSESALQLNAPALVPATGGAPIRAQAQQPWVPNRVDRYGRPIPPQPGVQAGFFTPDENPNARTNPNANPNDRRYRRPPQQGQGQNNQQRANRDDDDDDDDDDRPGLFRFRRQERQRAAAGRDR
jgi:hypothetical protein